MIIKDATQIDLTDMLIVVIWDGEENAHGVAGTTVHGVQLYHHGEFDEPITLADIVTKYPKTKLVIAERDLEGYVYRYGNNTDENGPVWEQVGKTIGYA